ncbi:TRM11 family SAM-dependent methyltransferase [Desulfurococcus mucosus]|uniref:RNA methylase n=1 Tax=Desulfurococcus mucosus (strain ATCC 35584 / DSM 2162 / JCM 9187 / O7/1) TaxID=765177 RepID=E8R8S1_DESM0|nr:DNA methyltransferase [Desulfurococcus mucosus]ADV64897.1 RNA methylase [Desulfurococcus mucosus DSM 2162]
MESSTSYFLLRGDGESLARGELKALLETYMCRGVDIKCYTMLCVVRHSCSGIEEKVTWRAGFIKEAGLLLGVDNPYNPSASIDPGLVEGEEIHPSILKKGVSEGVAGRYVSYFASLHGLKASSTGRGRLRLIFTDGLVFIGLKGYEQDSKAMLLRGGSHRPFKRSIALTPDVSRLLINLARVREGGILLDPFAGTGTILMEAWSMNIRAVGIEVDWRLAHGMEENLRFYRANAIPVLGDSTFINVVNVDAIATDPPYGRGASTHGQSQLALYDAFLGKAWDVLRSGSYMSFMTPAWLEDAVSRLLCRHGFTDIARYYQYVHGGLTRAIYVVRKDEC